MSCSNSNSPVDIQFSKISGKCDMKCDYKFNYSSSSCIATHQSSFISLSYDSSSVSPVIYNSIKYNVSKVKLYSPSLHTFAGNQAAAELVIEHTSTQGTNPLYVCVPISKRDVNSDVSSVLNKIINGVSQNAPSDGETTTISIDNFNLNTFVPFKPFFSYTANNFSVPCDQKVDFIVFNITNNESINIKQDDLTKLTELIGPSGINSVDGTPYFLNPKGPGIPGDGGDDIYIDCKPIDKSEEETTIIHDSGNQSSDFDFESMISNPIFQILVGSLLFVLLLFLVKLGIDKIYEQSAQFS